MRLVRFHTFGSQDSLEPSPRPVLHGLARWLGRAAFAARRAVPDARLSEAGDWLDSQAWQHPTATAGTSRAKLPCGADVRCSCCCKSPSLCSESSSSSLKESPCSPH